MAVELIGSDDLSFATVDPSKALRVALFDGSGQKVNVNETVNGISSFSCRTASVTGQGTFVSIGNYTPGINITITRLDLTAFFDGTAAATLMNIEVAKVIQSTAGLNNSTGAILGNTTPLSKQTSQRGNVTLQITANSVAQPSLVVGTFAISTVLAQFPVARVTQTALSYVSTHWSANYGSIGADSIQLSFGDAITIAWRSTQVIGDNLNGIVEWQENIV